MTHKVTWRASAEDACTVEVKLTAEAFAATKRDFVNAMDDALTECEEILAKEFYARTGKAL